MKRLTVVVMAMILIPSQIFAIDPGQLSFDFSSQRPAYPILPSKSVILGGEIDEYMPGKPTYIPNFDLSGGKACLNLNNIGTNPYANLWQIEANPSWGKPSQIQKIHYFSDTPDKPKYIINPNCNIAVFPDQNYIVWLKQESAKTDGLINYTIRVMNLDYKDIFTINFDDSKIPIFHPVSSQFFYLERGTKSNILDKSGRTIIESKNIEICNDPQNRFAIVDGKLFEFARMDFVPIEIYGFPGQKLYNFKNNCVEILSINDSRDPASQKSHAWRFDYKWDLLEELEVEKPDNSGNFEWKLWFGDYLVYYDSLEKSSGCGWHVYDYKNFKDKLFLPCQSFALLAQKVRLFGTKIFIPNPDGAWVVDLENMKVENRFFPSQTSILNTERGFFAIGFPCDQENSVAGYLLDENLKPIESTRTILPKAPNYLAFEKKIISIWQTYDPFYDSIKKINQYTVGLSVGFSYIGESSPKKISHYKFKSLYQITSGLCGNVFNDVLYIPTGIADYYSINLTTLKSQSFFVDELYFKYCKELINRPQIQITDMMTAFISQDKRMFVFDKWKNLKADADIRPMGGNSSQNIWVWWDKVVIAFDSYTMVYKLDGSSQFIDGRPVDFKNGYLTYIQKDSSGKEKMVGLDVDTSYQKTVWSAMPGRTGSSSIAKLGADFFSNGMIIGSDTTIIQTGLTNLSCQNIVSGSAYMMDSFGCANGRGCGNDSYMTKWMPATSYSIRRSYKNEFVITSTRGDGKTSGFNGTVYVCSWGDYGKTPIMTKLSEIAQIKNLQYGQSYKIRFRIPANLNIENVVDETPCFGIVVVGDGLLDVSKSQLERHDEVGRPMFDGTPISATNQVAVSVTVWTEQ
ncbi:MAG: hypothetical protein KA140_04560 [Caldisericia bacterium]|nr:hypothetical protein [Caldisericia bacterium]